MDRQERMISGAEADDIHIAERHEPFPTPGSREERRAERLVAATFLLAASAAVAFVVCFLLVPWRFRFGDNSGYKWFLPALGITLGVALFSLGLGSVLWARRLMPEEEAIEKRHDGPSPDEARGETAATIEQGVVDTGIGRRRLLRRSVGVGIGCAGVATLVPVIGGLVVNPRHTLSRTPWKTGMRLVLDDGTPVRPEDLRPGAFATVFPDVPEATTLSDTATMLIRLRPGTRVTPRPGQQGWMWSDYIAFSKICPHLGCAVGLFEQRTNTVLCPCHQSQFDVRQDGKPIFGPAARPLPQLPLTVDSDGYFVARSGYHEPIGPSYWERS